VSTFLEPTFWESVAVGYLLIAVPFAVMFAVTAWRLHRPRRRRR
jgi:hypothetical protein